MRVRFTSQASAVLDGTGNGMVGFQATGARWTIDAVSVKVSTVVKESTARVYAGYVGDQYYLDGTFSGSSGDQTDSVFYVEDGSTLLVAWTGGDAGSVATALIRGWRET